MNISTILAEDLFPMGYLCIVSIDISSGYGSCLLSKIDYPKQWNLDHFPYDEVMTCLIEQSIAEEDIGRTIEKMSLSTVVKALSGRDIYQVYYTCVGEADSVIYRKASFTKKGDDRILCFLQDITDEALALRQSNIRLQEELKKAVRQSNIANRMLSLLDREFRTHLFSLTGLTDMMMEENKENESDSPHYQRADQLIEQTYLAESYMIESLNDVRELRNIIHWDETLQSDQICIEEMLEFFDGPLSDHCEYISTLFSWDTSDVIHKDIISDETVLTSLISRLVRHIISNSSPGGSLELRVSEKAEEKDSSVYTFSLFSDRCNLSINQLEEGTMDYQGIFKEMQKDLNAIDFNLILLRKYTELLNGSYSIEDLKDGKRINLSFRFRRASASTSVSASSKDSALEINQDPFYINNLRNLEEFSILSATADSDESLPIPDFSGKTALVVDDNLINLEVTTRLLRNAGFLVVDVDDGQKGFEAYQRDQGQFDIIILDIRMPGMSGIEIARRIRSSGSRGATIPMIALTANDRPEERQQSLDAGMNDHLSKPVSPYLLYRVIEKYL